MPVGLLGEQIPTSAGTPRHRRNSSNVTCASRIAVVGLGR